MKQKNENKKRFNSRLSVVCRKLTHLSDNLAHIGYPAHADQIDRVVQDLRERKKFAEPEVDRIDPVCYNEG